MEPANSEHCQDLQPSERNHYFVGKFMTERDFTAEQSYFRGKAKLHNRYLHGFGTVCGLRVAPAEPASPSRLLVEPGLALDPWGREIVVPERVPLDLDDFGPRDGEAGVRREVSLYAVLEYREVLTEPVPSLYGGEHAGGEDDAQYARVHEGYHLSLRRQPPEIDEPFSLQLCRSAADAIREGGQAEQLHAILCKLVSRPCHPCVSDPALTLARISRQDGGAITAAEIDNCSHRHLALSMDLMLHLLLCLAGSQER